MPENLLSQRELRRYGRQIMLHEIGAEGQEKLKKASVLVIGAGGLGCPLLQYLTSAGIGRIGIAEFDLVNEENLQRQILYGSVDVGKLKSIIARDRLNELNSFVDIELFNLRIDSSNALRIFRNFDVIADATDNLETRFVINDACVALNKPMVHGAIYKFESQVAVFNYRGGATYRCYNPGGKKESDRNPLPSETGIFGLLPGITGVYMAAEVIKIITGSGKVLGGKVLHINIAENTFRTITVRNIPENHDIK